MFEVHFLDYANPGQRDSQSRCCRGQQLQDSCSSPCSTFFNVCLRPLNNRKCEFGEKSSDVLGNGSFVIPSSSLLQIPWPVNLQSGPVRMNLLQNFTPGESWKTTAPLENTTQKLWIWMVTLGFSGSTRSGIRTTSHDQELSLTCHTACFATATIHVKCRLMSLF